jgi:phenylacetate-CoA ligase
VNASMQQWKSRVVDIFHLESRKTLAIVGMGLGSWSGGDRYNLMLKSLALETSLPLTVFSPGTAHSEIVEIISRFGALYEQILIIIVPSAIYYLEKLANQSGSPLPYHKLAFIAPGEGFNEDLRKHVRQSAFPHKMTFISNYASADAELTGLESPELAEARALLNEHPEYADELGFKSRSIPNLFHVFPSAGYLENVDGRMVMTRWQGLPLARYDLHDSVQFFNWRTLCSELAAMSGDRTTWLENSRKPYTDVIGVFGRADQCVVILGNNLYGPMLEEVLMRSALGVLTTGHFVVWPSLSDGRQVLSWQIELKKGVTLTDDEIDQHYHKLVALLSDQQPSFAANRMIFSPQQTSGPKLFDFHFCTEPALSSNQRYRSGIKRRVVISAGPL